MPHQIIDPSPEKGSHAENHNNQVPSPDDSSSSNSPPPSVDSPPISSPENVQQPSPEVASSPEDLNVQQSSPDGLEEVGLSPSPEEGYVQPGAQHPPEAGISGPSRLNNGNRVAANTSSDTSTILTDLSTMSEYSPDSSEDNRSSVGTSSTTHTEASSDASVRESVSGMVGVIRSIEGSIGTLRSIVKRAQEMASASNPDTTSAPLIAVLESLEASVAMLKTTVDGSTESPEKPRAVSRITENHVQDNYRRGVKLEDKTTVSASSEACGGLFKRPVAPGETKNTDTAVRTEVPESSAKASKCDTTEPESSMDVVLSSADNSAVKSEKSPEVTSTEEEPTSMDVDTAAENKVPEATKMKDAAVEKVTSAAENKAPEAAKRKDAAAAVEIKAPETAKMKDATAADAAGNKAPEAAKKRKDAGSSDEDDQTKKRLKSEDE